MFLHLFEHDSSHLAFRTSPNIIECIKSCCVAHAEELSAIKTSDTATLLLAWSSRTCFWAHLTGACNFLTFSSIRARNDLK